MVVQWVRNVTLTDRKSSDWLRDRLGVGKYKKMRDQGR